ncbi:MAG: MATE family efflux transporter [Rhodobacteraceae bacterium]|nr:MATE family efflux transporter [Paracoccaceae bacterium]
MSDRHAMHQTGNPFLTAPVGRLFLSNALPMAVVMSMGGILNVVDGIFVGRFIGPDALAAVGLAFPVVMVLTALSTLIGGGMSSLLARHLGAGQRAAAERVFVGAHGLALAIAAALVAVALTIGAGSVEHMAVGNGSVAAMVRTYLEILILGAPVQFALGLHADALRNEGRAGLIAILSVMVNVFNVAANWLGIVVLGLGIAGSAVGTIAAQALGLALLIMVRARNPRLLPLASLRRNNWLVGWSEIIRLGLPLCLGFIGMALVATTVVVVLRESAGARYDVLVAAYGVVTRILGLAFLPQMAVALATQSITGNNAGAGRHDRAQAALRVALGTAFLWCLGMAAAVLVAGPWVGAIFSKDQAVAEAVATILRPMMFFYAFSGPVLVLALHFQALGQPARTAVLTLVKPWFLTPVLVLVAATAFGSRAIWFAFPAADAMLLMLATAMIRNARRRSAVHATEERT